MRIVNAIEAALQARSHVPAGPPSPWLGWLAVCLCRQRVRQQWLVRVARERLSDARDGEGDVPGLAGWRYSFHGQGLCLIGPGNESLDYDFHDDEGRTIDPYFFAWRVAGLDPAPLPEARLVRWLIGAQTIVSGLDELRRLGLLEPPASTHVFELCPSLEALSSRVAAARFDEPSVRASFAAHLGDRELAGDGAPRELADAHRDFLLSRLVPRASAVRVLREVASALPEDALAAACTELLRGPVDPTTGHAIEALDRCAAPFTAQVDVLLDRLDPAEHHPYAAWAAAKYLLARGAARERALATVLAFASVETVRGFRGNPYVAQLAMLLLEHAPERALPHVRAALRSTTPMVVEEMAALLASIDRPWCHRELEAAPRAPLGADRSASSCRRYVAAALAHCTGDLARRRARELAPPPPARAPGAIGFSGDEVRAHHVEAMIAGALEEAGPLADRLRERLRDDLS